MGRFVDWDIFRTVLILCGHEHCLLNFCLSLSSDCVREELFNLIGYVSVPLGAIQVEAISVVRHLASRRSGFMELFTAGSRYANEVIRFKEGFARALEESLQEPMAVEDLESTGRGPLRQ